MEIQSELKNNGNLNSMVEETIKRVVFLDLVETFLVTANHVNIIFTQCVDTPQLNYDTCMCCHKKYSPDTQNFVPVKFDTSNQVSIVQL